MRRSGRTIGEDMADLTGAGDELVGRRRVDDHVRQELGQLADEMRRVDAEAGGSIAQDRPVHREPGVVPDATVMLRLEARCRAPTRSRAVPVCSGRGLAKGSRAGVAPGGRGAALAPSCSGPAHSARRSRVSASRAARAQGIPVMSFNRSVRLRMLYLTVCLFWRTWAFWGSSARACCSWRLLEQTLPALVIRRGHIRDQPVLDRLEVRLHARDVDLEGFAQPEVGQVPAELMRWCSNGRRSRAGLCDGHGRPNDGEKKNEGRNRALDRQRVASICSRRCWSCLEFAGTAPWYCSSGSAPSRRPTPGTADRWRAPWPGGPRSGPTRHWGRGPGAHRSSAPRPAADPGRRRGSPAMSPPRGCAGPARRRARSMFAPAPDRRASRTAGPGGPGSGARSARVRRAQ